MHLYFTKVRKKEKKSPTAAVCRSPTGTPRWPPTLHGSTRSCSPPRRPSPAGSCSPATELLAGREERLTRRGAPHQPRGAARRCSPPGGPARRRVELQSQIEPINLVTAHTELVQVYSVNFPTLLQSFGHFSMNLVRNRAIVTTKTPFFFVNRLQRQTAEKSTLFAER